MRLAAAPAAVVVMAVAAARRVLDVTAARVQAAAVGSRGGTRDPDAEADQTQQHHPNRDGSHRKSVAPAGRQRQSPLGRLRA